MNTTAATKPPSSPLLELINKTVELPTIPAVLTRLNEVISQPDSSASDVAKVIAADPAVATNILRIVNSAYYGLQVRVSSVSLAVSIMGFHMTKKVALKAAVLATFARKPGHASAHFDAEQFWRHSFFTGVAARFLAQKTPQFDGVHPEDVHVCGLLHDIGKIILMQSRPREFGDALEACARGGMGALECEQQTLGFTHADVGSVLAIKWFLPEDLTGAIRFHHAPLKDPFGRPLSALIHVADSVAWEAGFPSTSGLRAPAVEPEALARIGLTAADIQSLLPKVREEFARSETI